MASTSNAPILASPARANKLASNYSTHEPSKDERRNELRVAIKDKVIVLDHPDFMSRFMPKFALNSKKKQHPFVDTPDFETEYPMYKWHVSILAYYYLSGQRTDTSH